MQKIYYFHIPSSGKNICQVNDGLHHPTLQAEEYSSFQVQVEDGTNVSYMQFKYFELTED